MRAYIRSGRDWGVFFGSIDGSQIIDLSASRNLDLSPFHRPEAMIWAFVRGDSH